MKFNFNILLPVTLILGWSEAFCQREDYNWIMGACSPLSDSTWSRIHWIFDDNGNFSEQRTYKISHPLDYTNASISDSLGQLLFYTNGLSVYNRNYQVMPNGTGLNPGIEANNSKDTGYKLEGGALILPWPDHPQKYFILHLPTDRISFEFFSLNLFTTLVDMKLDNEKGAVIYKNKSVYADSLGNGTLIACKHANGRDWWIPVFHYSQEKCFVFLLDPSGVNLHHVQEIPFSFEYTTRRGQAQFSLDGTKYTFCKANNLSYREFFLAEFDRCTGLFSNIQFDIIPLFHWCGVAFSLNSKFLYLATGTELFQLDMNDKKPFQTRIKVDSIDGFESFPLFPSYFSLMQLAPDNKIYINNGTSPDYISTIESPNIKGIACNVRQHNIHITSNATLPNFPYFRLGALEGSTCDTLARGRLPIANWSSKQDSFNHLRFDFTDHSLFEIREWNWDFGDSTSIDNISNLQNPNHTFSHNGLYDVCLIVKNKIGSDTLCQNLKIETVGVHDIKVNLPSSIILSPIPCKDFMILNITDYNSQQMTLHLYNSIGEKIKSCEIFKGNNSIDIENLNTGVYFISIFENSKPIKTEKFLKI